MRGYASGVWRRALWQGLPAGAAGVVVTTLGEKAEQRLTGRPGSYVPARTLERLTGMPERPGPPRAANRAMHHGQGALLGVVRSVTAHAGPRGPVASTRFTVVRLTSDQILENATGAGAPPQTWPRAEPLADLVHKAVYALATGAVADALAARSGPGRRHAAKRPDRRADAGPLPRREAHGH